MENNVRTYYIDYINYDGKLVTKSTPFYVCAKSIAEEVSKQHGSAHISCSDPTFYGQFFEQGQRIFAEEVSERATKQ